MVMLLRLVCCAAWFLLASGWSWAAPRPEPKQPLSLSISVDRETYLPYEPIWVDWAVTNHGSESLHVSPEHAPTVMDFQFATANEKNAELEPRCIICYQKPLPFGVIESGKSLRGWFNLRDARQGLPTVGALRLRTTAHFAFSRTRPLLPLLEGINMTTVSSNTVKLEVVKPAGLDRDTIRFICGEKDKPEDPDTDAHDRYGDWGWRRCWAVFEQSKSERFRAAASLYCGIQLPEEMARERVTEEGVRKAMQSLRYCKDSPGSSRYLRGLATLHLARCSIRKTSFRNHKEAKALGELLLADYPDTAIAAEAKELLARLNKGD
jgi:hypothetical protein